MTLMIYWKHADSSEGVQKHRAEGSPSQKLKNDAKEDNFFVLFLFLLKSERFESKIGGESSAMHKLSSRAINR